MLNITNNDPNANKVQTQNQNPKPAKNFAFSYPILETNPNSTVYLKHCENDPTGWQIVPKGIKINDDDFVNVYLKFTINQLVEDLGQLYYRDSWVYESQRYQTNNLPIDMEKEVTSVEGSEENNFNIKDSEITYKTIRTNTNTNANGSENGDGSQSQSQTQIKTEISVSLNTRVARGNYMVFSKIVDSFGQPIAELNWFAKMTGGNLDMAAFKEDNTVAASAVRDSFEVKTGEGEERVKVDKITAFKSEMKRDFKNMNQLRSYEKTMTERL